MQRTRSGVPTLLSHDFRLRSLSKEVRVARTGQLDQTPSHPGLGGETMQSQDTANNLPIIGRTTILILCGLLIWLFFVSDAGSVPAKLALFGGVAGIVSYLGLLFSGRPNAAGDSATA